uniref:Uncharacterized protein n=1 Tax=Naja naja TaxID=35670 RepID=A0A8C6YG23_NAJNA
RLCVWKVCHGAGSRDGQPARPPPASTPSPLCRLRVAQLSRQLKVPNNRKDLGASASPPRKPPALDQPRSGRSGLLKRLASPHPSPLSPVTHWRSGRCC